MFRSSEPTPQQFLGCLRHDAASNLWAEVHRPEGFTYGATQSSPFESTWSAIDSLSSENFYSPMPTGVTKLGQTPRNVNLPVRPNETASWRANGFQTPCHGDGPQILNPPSVEACHACIGYPTNQPSLINSCVGYDLDPHPNTLLLWQNRVLYSGTESSTPGGTNPSRMQLRNICLLHSYSAALPDNSSLNEVQSRGDMPASQIMERERHVVSQYLPTRRSTHPIGPYGEDVGPGNQGYATDEPGTPGTFWLTQASPRPVAYM